MAAFSSLPLDGTVLTYDLIRYRNFCTFTSPSPVQSSNLAVDPSGEVVAAGSTDSFEVFLWSVQTGKLLDIMAGHTGQLVQSHFRLQALLMVYRGNTRLSKTRARCDISGQECEMAAKDGLWGWHGWQATTPGQGHLLTEERKTTPEVPRPKQQWEQTSCTKRVTEKHVLFNVAMWLWELTPQAGFRGRLRLADFP